LQKKAREDADYRGSYVFRIDASSIVQPTPAPSNQQLGGAPQIFPFALPSSQLRQQQAPSPKRHLPEITSIAMNSSISSTLPFSESDVGTIGGRPSGALAVWLEIYLPY
jgi:hypothetical protein